MIHGQRYESADVTDVGWFCLDPAWVLEQKLDGIRCIVAIDAAGRCSFLGHTGAPLRSGTKHFAGIARRLTGLTSITLDGELLANGTLWVFDILVAVGTDVRDLPFATRRQMLETIAPAFGTGGFVELVPQAVTPDAKARLWERVIALGAEGVVAKRLAGRYAATGKRTRDVLKIKVTRTIDCVVTGLGRKGHNAATLGLYRDGVLTEVGACSLNGKPTVAIGEVVEVTYLYVVDPAAPSLYQPRMMRTRPDRIAESCDFDQLTGSTVSKAVLV